MKLIAVSIFVFLTSVSIGQTVVRSSINCIGSSGGSGPLFMQQTAGQPYGTSTYYSNKIESRPGFIQPQQIWVEQMRNTFDLKITVYPNPAASEVSFKLDQNLEDIILTVLDQHGKMIYRDEIASLRDYKLNCQDWINGFYFININDRVGNSYQSKLIKQ